jgi:outer membrane protein OmpA-like peptidoglycan-associated protein
MHTQGFGDTQPVAPNKKPDGSDDPDGRQKNRRVEISLRKS